MQMRNAISERSSTSSFSGCGKSCRSWDTARQADKYYDFVISKILESFIQAQMDCRNATRNHQVKIFSNSHCFLQNFNSTKLCPLPLSHTWIWVSYNWTMWDLPILCPLIKQYTSCANAILDCGACGDFNDDITRSLKSSIKFCGKLLQDCLS